MSEPLISVCIITHNHLNYIRDAIEGVLTQKINFRIKLIIADDYSTDGTREIVLAYKDKHPDIITLILQEENVGVSKNWFDMVSTPKSKYIAFCDGDDYWTDPYKLQKQVDFLENNPDYAICYHPVEYLYADPKPKRIFDETYRESETTYTRDLIRNNYISTVSCVLRRDYIENIPSWFKDVIPLDWPLLILASFGKKIFRINEKMATYRVHDNSIWGTKKITYYHDRMYNVLASLEKSTPDAYLQNVRDKKFDISIELYKSYLIEGKIIAAFRTIPRIFSYRHHQNMKNYLMASKIVVVSFIRKFIKKRTM